MLSCVTDCRPQQEAYWKCMSTVQLQQVHLRLLWLKPADHSGLLELRLNLRFSLQARQRPELPRVLVLVTGKGPQQKAYRARMRGMDLRRVAFRTLWLEAADYPLLLGSCDLGVCLHTSSSGFDLPMKVPPDVPSSPRLSWWSLPNRGSALCAPA